MSNPKFDHSTLLKFGKVNKLPKNPEVFKNNDKKEFAIFVPQHFWQTIFCLLLRRYREE